MTRKEPMTSKPDLESDPEESSNLDSEEIIESGNSRGNHNNNIKVTKSHVVAKGQRSAVMT